jgi:SAM-dependent methyltransferase
MGLKFERSKPRHLLLTLFYRTNKMIPILSPQKRARLFLDLEWIFQRLAYETALNHKLFDGVIVNSFLLNHLPENAEVLDIGCGYGTVAATLIPHVKSITGVDHNADKIAVAKKEVPQAEFYCDDAFNFLAGKKADVAILSHVLEHLDNPGDFLSKLSALVKYVYIEVPDFETTVLNPLRVAVSSKLTFTDNDHIHEFDREELNNLVEASGLKIQAAEYKLGVLKLWCQSNI